MAGPTLANPMCLLALLHKVRTEEPLVLAANRDEWLARRATPMQVLRASDPRILGGRDEVAGGTWLALNEHGVIAGLTNRPILLTGAEPRTRSRGELPLILARQSSAERAVAALRADASPSDYNPCWLLVADRDDAFYLDMTGDVIRSERLSPGIIVLENKPLRAPSRKVDQVRTRLGEHERVDRAGLPALLQGILREHGSGTDAACVHADPYGTRSATVAVVDATSVTVAFADGAPCQTPFGDASHLWVK